MNNGWNRESEWKNNMEVESILFCIVGHEQRTTETDVMQVHLSTKFRLTTTKWLQQIHAYVFGGLYDFAGKIRTNNISNEQYLQMMIPICHCIVSWCNTQTHWPNATHNLWWDSQKICGHEYRSSFYGIKWQKYSSLAWFNAQKTYQKCIDRSQITKNDYMQAMIVSPRDSSRMIDLMRYALTDDIHSHEMCMKGIDYSYYYEQE